MLGAWARARGGLGTAARGALPALVVAWIAAAPASAAPWHVELDRGLRALDHGDARGAERAFRRALAKRSDSACAARTYGVHFRPYLPHYHLGVALALQGRESEAAVELSRELAAGVVEACPGAEDTARDLRLRLAALAVETAESPREAARSAPAALAVAAPAPSAGAERALQPPPSVAAAPEQDVATTRPILPGSVVPAADPASQPPGSVPPEPPVRVPPVAPRETAAPGPASVTGPRFGLLLGATFSRGSGGSTHLLPPVP